MQEDADLQVSYNSLVNIHGGYVDNTSKDEKKLEHEPVIDLRRNSLTIDPPSNA